MLFELLKGSRFCQDSSEAESKQGRHEEEDGEVVIYLFMSEARQNGGSVFISEGTTPNQGLGKQRPKSWEERRGRLAMCISGDTASWTGEVSRADMFSAAETAQTETKSSMESHPIAPSRTERRGCGQERLKTRNVSEIIKLSGDLCLTEKPEKAKRHGNLHLPLF